MRNDEGVRWNLIDVKTQAIHDLNSNRDSKPNSKDLFALISHDSFVEKDYFSAKTIALTIATEMKTSSRPVFLKMSPLVNRRKTTTKPAMSVKTKTMVLTI